MPNLSLAQDAAADELLGRDPLALLLDQHMRRRSSGAVVAPRIGYWAEACPPATP